MTNIAFSYFTLDHLGSVAVVTDAGGAVVQRLSYDPWGKQRNPNGSPASCGSISSPTSRGFTNQEQVPGGCLVNLNARLYDPEIGRMMAPDPVIGSPFVPQELNRYTYVLNNPLSLTDPTGLCFLGCFWHTSLFRSVAAIALAATLQWAVLPAIEGAAFAEGTFGSVLNAGISGGASGYVSTGKLKGALLGAAEAVAFAGVHFAKLGMGFPEQAAAYTPTQVLESAGMHGMVGGLASAAGGGKFASGFLAAAFSDGAGDDQGSNISIQGTVTHAITGGIGSILGGGKFENGAVTGAFGYLYNGMLGRGTGSLIAGSIVGAAGAETGPFDIFLIGGADYVGGEIGSAIEDEFFSNNGLVGANYAQATYSETFSKGGAFSGQTVGGVADGLRTGRLVPSNVPVEFIVRDGNTLILNTRSAVALEAAGIPRSKWTGVDMTGNPAAEARLTGQLQRNGLTSRGTPIVRMSGRGGGW